MDGYPGHGVWRKGDKGLLVRIFIKTISKRIRKTCSLVLSRATLTDFCTSLCAISRSPPALSPAVHVTVHRSQQHPDNWR